MLYALCNEKKSKAEPGLDGGCPWCGGEMIPKCGDVMIWHWAHKVNPCDTKEETEWHLRWKSRLPQEWVETEVLKDGVRKIADVMTDYREVVEFQHSPISYGEIKEREKHYGFMRWVIDASEAHLEGRIKRIGQYEIRWKRPKRNWTYCKRPVWLDFGDGSVFSVSDNVKTVDDNDIPIQRITGRVWGIEDFVTDLIQGPKDLLHGCCYKGRPCEVHYKACQWHREEKDLECEGCQQWKYPFYWRREDIYFPYGKELKGGAEDPERHQGATTGGVTLENHET